ADVGLAFSRGFASGSVEGGGSVFATLACGLDAFLLGLEPPGDEGDVLATDPESRGLSANLGGGDAGGGGVPGLATGGCACCGLVSSWLGFGGSAVLSVSAFAGSVAGVLGARISGTTAAARGGSAAAETVSSAWSQAPRMHIEASAHDNEK